MAESTSFVKCKMCSFKSPMYETIVAHTVRRHRFDPSFIATCSFDGCGASYSKWSSYKSHVRRKHGLYRELLDVTPAEPEPAELHTDDASDVEQGTAGAYYHL